VVREIVAIYRELDFNEAIFESTTRGGEFPHQINLDWKGRPAPGSLATTACLFWSEREIVVCYECDFTELDMDEQGDLAVERHALWDRDVCEAFIRSPLEPHTKSYREFEVAPSGQWCDLLVDRLAMWHNWEWQSGMRTFASIDKLRGVWRAAMAIPFTAFGCRPEAGDRWQANLFRISRLEGERQYLAFSPTMTETPNFHVAESFVDLIFSPKLEGAP